MSKELAVIPKKSVSVRGSGHTGSKFDAGRKKVIFKAVEKGHTQTFTAQLASITPQTLYNWLERGRACDENGDPLEPEYQKFLLEYKLAEAKWVDSRLQLIDDAAKTSWQAAAWQLERRFPQEFGRKERVDLATDEPIKVKLSW